MEDTVHGCSYFENDAEFYWVSVKLFDCVTVDQIIRPVGLLCVVAVRRRRRCCWCGGWIHGSHSRQTGRRTRPTDRRRRFTRVSHHIVIFTVIICSPCVSTTTQHHNRFTAPLSGTTRVSWYHKRTPGLYDARED